MQVLGQWVNGAANNDQMRTKEFYEKPSVIKHGRRKRQLSVNAKPIVSELLKWACSIELVYAHGA